MTEPIRGSYPRGPS